MAPARPKAHPAVIQKHPEDQTMLEVKCDLKRHFTSSLFKTEGSLVEPFARKAFIKLLMRRLFIKLWGKIY